MPSDFPGCLPVPLCLQVHPTFQLQDAPGKIMRFRESNIWLADDAEYYDGGRNFLLYDVQLPRSLAVRD